MQIKRMAVFVIAAAMLSGGVVFGQQAEKPMDPGMMGGEARGGHGGMMGMMDMMPGCHRMMMGGAAMGQHMVPQLPPGNERLQLQMHGEMMQRMGEILTKYAAQVEENRPRAR